MFEKPISISVALCIVLLTGCGQASRGVDSKPHESYQSYHASVVQGISFGQDAAFVEGMSFDLDAEFHSKAKQVKVRSMMKAMESSSKRSSERIIELYLDMKQRAAKCAELVLQEERIEGKTAYLMFDRKDICGNSEVKLGGEKITIVLKKGWKIDDSLSIY